MKILFIKSTSIQHLALSFERVMERFKCGVRNAECGITSKIQIDVLAHPHAVDSLKGFGFINRIIPYNSKGNFSPLHIFRGYISNIRKEKYDMVIVPFNNMSGAGYENVMALAICTGAGHIVTCNRTGDTKALDIKKALLRVVRGYFYYPLALLMTVALSVIVVIGIIGFTIYNLRPLTDSIGGRKSKIVDCKFL
ncbi:MAG: hypothetical protein HY096_00780 [Nitrospinae bacterium]|nr:hypothetical protein [Nitrospinota bacterium]